MQGSFFRAPWPLSRNLSAFAAVNIRSSKKEGGTYVVPVLINETITLDFIVDSGAADVSIPADVVLTLIRTGTIQDVDFVGTQTYVLADGSKVLSATFRIRSLTVGGITVENVIGSMVPVSGALLLGQSFLNRFNSWSFDNGKQSLVFLPRSDAADRTTPTASEFYRFRYLLTGFLLRAAAVCENDSKRTTDAGFRLLDDPELKATSKAYPQTISKWMEEGATNFNDAVMTDRVRKACAVAFEVRNKIEGSSSRQIGP